MPKDATLLATRSFPRDCDNCNSTVAPDTAALNSARTVSDKALATTMRESGTTASDPCAHEKSGVIAERAYSFQPSARAAIDPANSPQAIRTGNVDRRGFIW
ncbi:MAG: hypothetical protein KBF58_12795 [Methyloversatilis sp.]|nr:hypothetical protein [Methyloversatilis sp.]